MTTIVAGRLGVVAGLLAVFLVVPVPSAGAVAPDDAWWFKAMNVKRAHAAGWTGEGGPSPRSVDTGFGVRRLA